MSPPTLEKNLEDLMARMAAFKIKSRVKASVVDKASSSSSKKPIFTPQSDMGKVIAEITTKSLANLPEPKMAPESEPEKEKEKQIFQKFSSKIPQTELPKFDGKELEQFLKKFARYFRISGLNNASEQLQKDFLILSCQEDSQKIVKNFCESHSFQATLDKLSKIWQNLTLT